MSGLRIHHPELRNCQLVIFHPGTPATATTRGRGAKNYHIDIDNDGYAIVSETVWMRLQEAFKGGAHHSFTLINEVADPPTLHIGWGETEEKRIYQQINDVAREFAPDGVVPRITKGR